MFQVNKPKSAAKIMIPPSEVLSEKVLYTLDHLAEMAGATLGPGGRQVLIERPEINMKPIVTKDGVTVIKHLGFEDPVCQLILEAARDAANRTASQAGDGTTTATILSSSIARQTDVAVKQHRKLSPQKIVRDMQKLVPFIESRIKKYSFPADDEDILMKVATLSANGDVELSKTIIEGFNLVGDDGNMTIVEANGPSRYEIKRIHGYTVETGYELSLRRMSQGFLNDKSGTKVLMEAPLVILYDGVVNDIYQILEGLNAIGEYVNQSKQPSNYVAFVAHGFSETVINDFYYNWVSEKSLIRVVPILTPEDITLNYRTHFLHDLSAYTGCPVFNPINKPLKDVNPSLVYKNSLTTKIEIDRYKTNIFAHEDSDSISLRVEELKEQLKSPESQYEEYMLKVRISKLTAGIAQLMVYGYSQGETREKRDRAEDAWMAIKGAAQYGACPGGGYVLVRLSADLEALSPKIENASEKLATKILSSALRTPVEKLYQNYGYSSEEIDAQIISLLRDDDKTFDILEQSWVPKEDLLDSVPAVMEAVRNSLSIASLLGSLGGIVAFKRDYQSDKEEEKFVRKHEEATGARGSVEASNE